MRVAVIGLGNAARTLHLPALAGIGGVEIVGGMDIDAARCQEAKAKFAIPVFSDFDEMVAKSKPELILVGTLPDTHANYCLRSFAAGAHVLCEKPFVSSLAEADQVLAAARSSNRRIALNHDFREMSIFRAVLDAAHSGDTGGLVFAQVWQLMDLPGWAEPGWRGQMLNRTLFEAGVHLVDFILALFGERPIAVDARTSNCGMHASESDAVALVTLEFSRGRLAQITQNRLCKGETQYFEVRADTERASLRASYGGRARILAGLFRSSRPSLRIEYGVSGTAWRERAGRRELLARNPKNSPMLATRRLIEHTLNAFREGSEPPVSGEVGRDVIAVIAAAYRSAAIGKRSVLDKALLAELHDVRLG